MRPVHDHSPTPFTAQVPLTGVFGVREGIEQFINLQYVAQVLEEPFHELAAFVAEYPSRGP